MQVSREHILDSERQKAGEDVMTELWDTCMEEMWNQTKRKKYITVNSQQSWKFEKHFDIRHENTNFVI